MKFIFIMKSKLFNTVLLPLALVVMFSCKQEINEDDNRENGKEQVVVKPPIGDCLLIKQKEVFEVLLCEKPDFSSFLLLNGMNSFPIGSFPKGKYAESVPIDDLSLLIFWDLPGSLSIWHPSDSRIDNMQPEASIKQKIMEIHDKYARFPVSTADLLKATSYPFSIYYVTLRIQDLRIYFIPRGSDVPVDVSGSVTLYSGHPYLGYIISDDPNAPLCIPWPDGMPLDSYVALHPLVNCRLYAVLDPNKTDISGWGHFCVRYTFTDGSVKEVNTQNQDSKILR